MRASRTGLVLAFMLVTWSCGLGVVGTPLPDTGTKLEAGPDVHVGGDSSTLDAATDAGPSYVAEVLADNPLAYWRFEETTGTVAHDERGAFDGTFDADCVLGVPGAIGRAVHFQNNCEVDLQDHFAFEGNAPFSIEAWVLGEGTDTNRHVFTRENRPAGPSDGYALLLSHAPQATTFERFVTSGSAFTSGDLPPAAFAHVVGTYDGKLLTLFIDGVAQPLPGGDQRALTTAPVHAFIGSAGGGNHFRGVIDEVAVYDHALTPARIAAHHAAR